MFQAIDKPGEYSFYEYKSTCRQEFATTVLCVFLKNDKKDLIIYGPTKKTENTLKDEEISFFFIKNYISLPG